MSIPQLKLDYINELTVGGGTTINGVLAKNNDLTISTLSQNTTNTTTLAPGWVSGFALTDNGDGSVGIASGVCYLRESNSDSAPIHRYTVNANTNIALNQGTNMIGITYNSGSPIFYVTTDVYEITNNQNSVIDLYYAYLEGVKLDYTIHRFDSEGIARKGMKMIHRSWRQRRISGMVLSELSDRHIAVTAGNVFISYTELFTPAIDTSATDLIKIMYKDGTGWVSYDDPQYDNTKWNDFGVSLATLTDNYYGFVDFFMVCNKRLIGVVGRYEFEQYSDAVGAKYLFQETNRPTIVDQHSEYVGRIVYRKGVEPGFCYPSPLSSFDPTSQHTNLIGKGNDDHLQYALLNGRDGDVLKIDVIQEQTLNHGVSFGTINVDDVNITTLSGSFSQKLVSTLTTNPGVIIGFGITDNGDGTVEIADGSCYLRSAPDDDLAYFIKYDIVAVAGMTFTDESSVKIYINYNAGFPFIDKTTGTVDENQNITLYNVYRSGTELYIVNCANVANGIGRRAQKYIKDVMNIRRVSGMILSGTGTRKLVVSTGIAYLSVSIITTPAIDTSATDTMKLCYYNGSAWITSSVSEWPNTQWNNTATGLVTMTANYYSYLDCYLCNATKLVLVYGSKEYKIADDAKSAVITYILPPLLSSPNNPTYLGRIVFQKSNDIPTIILGFLSHLSYEKISDHSNMINLDVDTHTQYALLDGRNGNTLKIDTINEYNTDSGVLVEGNLLKDNTLFTDTIGEKTSGSGTTIDGVLLKSNGITSSGTSSLTTINTDTINEKTSGNGVSVEGVLIKDSDITIGGVSQTLNSKITRTTGVITGFGITNNGDGSINVASGTCYLRATNDDMAEVVYYTVSGVNNMALTDNTFNFISIIYNAGSPIIYNYDTNYDIVNNNQNNNFSIYSIWRAGTELYIGDHKQSSAGIGRKIQKYLHDTSIQKRTSGMILGETGTRNLTVSAGKMWIMLVENSTPAIDTSGSDTVRIFYTTGSNVWVQANGTQWPNTQWNNTSSGLTTMTDSYYSYHDFYMCEGQKLILIYGQAEFDTSLAAGNAPISAVNPPLLQYHTEYIGRLVFQKSAGTAYSIVNPYTNTVSFGSNNNHSNLTGLDNDDHPQYALLNGRDGDTLKIDNITEFNTGVGTTIDGLLLKSGDMTINTLSQYETNNHTLTPGVISGFGITDNGDGTVNIASGTCYLRSSHDNNTGFMKKFSVSGVNNLTPYDGYTNMIYIDYNSGSPEIMVSNTNLQYMVDDEMDDISLYHVLRYGTRLTIVNHANQSLGLGTLIQKYLHNINTPRRTTGLLIGETGTRYITMSTGKLWLKLNELTIPAVDTSVSGDVTAMYWNGSIYAFNITTQWPNTQYNNYGLGTLVNMTDGYYSYLDFYLINDVRLGFGYGIGEYSDPVIARSQPHPENPGYLTDIHSEYLGRFIFQKGASTTTGIYSSYIQYESATGTLYHNQLIGLTSGDDHTQYALLNGRSGNIIKTDTVNEFTTNSGTTLNLNTIKDGSYFMNGTTNAIMNIDRNATSNTVEYQLSTNGTNEWKLGSSSSGGFYLYNTNLGNNSMSFNKTNNELALLGNINFGSYGMKDANYSTAISIGDVNNTTLNSKFINTSIVGCLNELKEVCAYTNDPTGIVDAQNACTCTFTSGTRTFSISPTSTSFILYVQGKKFVKSSANTLVISATEGLHWIFYNDSGTLIETTVRTNLYPYSLLYANIAAVYWDVTNSIGSYFTSNKDIHGIGMDQFTHVYLHTSFGTKFVSGGALGTFNIASGTITQAQFSIDATVINDEDIQLSLSSLASTVGTRVWYRNGASPGVWRYVDNAGFNHLSGPGNRPYYNQLTGGNWTRTEIALNYVLMHVFATNDSTRPYQTVMGQAMYTTVGTARTNAPLELQAILSTAYLPFEEFVALGTVIIQGNSTSASNYGAIIQYVSGSTNYYDWRYRNLTATSTVSSHSALTGLGNDDHTQYALLAGRSGGQTIIGGTSSGNSLTLQTTSNATKGNYVLTDRTLTTTGPEIMVINSGKQILNSPITTIITGTTNRISITDNGNGTITLTGPQDIGTSSTPTYANIISTNSPTIGSHCANKTYVDGVANGIVWHNSVRVATTGDITLSGEQTIDTVSVVAGNRVLVWMQSDATTNGVYDVSASTWTRSSDSNTNTLLIKAGYTVSEGSANINREFVNTNTSITQWTTAITFVIKGSNQPTHNNQTGLQGGTTNEYYHITSAQYNNLYPWLNTVVLNSNGSMNLSATGSLTCLSSISTGSGTINNSITDTSGSGSSLMTFTRGSNVWTIGQSSSNNFSIVNGSNGLSIDATNGRITSVPTYNYSIGSSPTQVYMDSSGTFGYLPSTRESKMNISSISNDDISWLNTIIPRKFQMRTKDENGNYTNTPYDEVKYGLIVDEVSNIKNELVSYDGNGNPRSIFYDKLIIPLVKGYQILSNANTNANISIDSIVKRTGDYVDICGSKMYPDGRISCSSMDNTVSIGGIPWLDVCKTMSSGVIEGMIVSQNVLGTINITAGKVRIRPDEISIPEIKIYTAINNMSIQSDVFLFVYVNYTNGVVASTQIPGSFNTNVMIAQLYYSSITDTMSISSACNVNICGEDIRNILRIGSTGMYKRSNGLMLGSDNLHITISPGAFWGVLNKYRFNGFNSNTTSFMFCLYAGPCQGMMNEIDTNHYNYNGTLSDISPDKYGVHWVYLSENGLVRVLCGDINGTLNDALASDIPTGVPAEISVNCICVGRLIFMKGSSEMTYITSAFTGKMSFNSTMDHNKLDNLDLDSHTQYALLSGRSDDILKINKITPIGNVIDIGGKKIKVFKGSVGSGSATFSTSEFTLPARFKVSTSVRNDDGTISCHKEKNYYMYKTNENQYIVSTVSTVYSTTCANFTINEWDSNSYKITINSGIGYYNIIMEVVEL